MPNRYLNRDPGPMTLFIGLMSFYTGVSLAMPGDAFAINPIYSEVRKIGWPDDAWGLILIGLGVGLVVSAFRGRAVVRAAIASISALFFTLWGILTLIGSWNYGLFGAGGATFFTAAALLIAAASQWSNKLYPAPRERPPFDGEQPWT